MRESDYIKENERISCIKDLYGTDQLPTKDDRNVLKVQLIKLKHFKF